jgi:hypothetical protein
MSSTTAIGEGSVVSLWRYPVKSMMGEEVNASRVAERGLVGDRAYALIDRADGKVVSAKQPRKWPALFAFRAVFAEPPRPEQAIPPVWVTLPNGDRVSSDQRDVDEILSGALGRAVTLRATAPERPMVEYLEDPLAPIETIADFPAAAGAPPGTFFDYASIHLLTTATIDRLREVYPQGRFEVRRFRPNVVVEPPAGAKGFVENAWVGRTLAIGDELRLRVTDPCPRCVMTTLPQGDLPRDLGILRAAADHNRIHVPFANQDMASVGVYATVERGGRIRRGDRLRLED